MSEAATSGESRVKKQFLGYRRNESDRQRHEPTGGGGVKGTQFVADYLTSLTFTYQFGQREEEQGEHQLQEQPDQNPEPVAVLDPKAERSESSPAAGQKPGATEVSRRTELPRTRRETPTVSLRQSEFRPGLPARSPLPSPGGSRGPAKVSPRGLEHPRAR